MHRATREVDAMMTDADRQALDLELFDGPVADSPSEAEPVDTGDAALFLTELYGCVERGELSFNFKAGEFWRTSWHGTELSGLIRGVGPGLASDLWVPIGTRRERIADGRRGTERDVLDVVALVVDVDHRSAKHRREDLPPDLDACRELVDDFGVAPTCIVGTGNGLQAWWFAAEPWAAEDVKPVLGRWRANWRELGRRRGWHVDSTASAEHVFRLPGSTNTSTGTKAAVLWADWSRRFNLDDVDEVCVDELVPPRPKPARRERPGGDELPGDRFNERYDVAVLLERHGCRFSHSTRAGDSHYFAPHRATSQEQTGLTLYADGHVAIWSETFASEHGLGTGTDKVTYDAFGLYAHLEHGGDFSAAARAARALYPPTPLPAPPPNVDPATGEILEARRALEIPNYFSDAEVGEAFGALLLGRYLHCRALGGWLRWDGRRWRRDESESVFEEARRYVLDLGVKLFETGADSKTIAAAARYRDRAKLDAIVTIARRLDGIAAAASDFDQHPDLLNARNGVIDLRTGELQPHDPTLRITQCTNVDYRPDATHADVTAVLQAVSDDVRPYLQKLCGYAATGHVTEDVMPVDDGNGSNGKTTLLTAKRAALGDYASVADARLLMKSAHEEHPTLFADLRGRRLVTIEETAEGGSLRVEAMKFLTGGSPIKARFIRGDYFEFTPTHLLIIGTNHRPAVNSTEHATWRRLRLIPFPYRYAKPDEMRPGDRPVDLKLRDRLQHGRQQREAMLAWIVAGAAAWNRDGLGECREVTVATDAWRRSEDVILRYCHDRLEFDPHASESVQTVYDRFRDWCDSEGRTPTSLKEFRKRFEEHDIFAANHVAWRKTMHGARWFGVGFKQPGMTDMTGIPITSDTRPRERLSEVPSYPSCAGDSPPEPPPLEADPPACGSCGAPLDNIGCCSDLSCAMAVF
jgi:putative DNA primase/helicase